VFLAHEQEPIDIILKIRYIITMMIHEVSHKAVFSIKPDKGLSTLSLLLHNLYLLHLFLWLQSGQKLNTRN